MLPYCPTLLSFCPLLMLHFRQINDDDNDDCCHTGRHTSPVSLMCHPGRDSGRLPLTNLLFRRSTFPPSANGLFQFPAPTSGTVFHHMWHLHRCLRYSDSVLTHFSFSCHIRNLIFWFAPCFIIIFLLFRPRRFSCCALPFGTVSPHLFTPQTATLVLGRSSGLTCSPRHLKPVHCQRLWYPYWVFRALQIRYLLTYLLAKYPDDGDDDDDDDVWVKVIKSRSGEVGSTPWRRRWGPTTNWALVWRRHESSAVGSCWHPAWLPVCRHCWYRWWGWINLRTDPRTTVPCYSCCMSVWHPFFQTNCQNDTVKPMNVKEFDNFFPVII